MARHDVYSAHPHPGRSTSGDILNSHLRCKAEKFAICEFPQGSAPKHREILTRLHTTGNQLQAGPTAPLAAGLGSPVEGAVSDQPEGETLLLRPTGQGPNVSVVSSAHIRGVCGLCSERILGRAGSGL